MLQDMKGYEMMTRGTQMIKCHFVTIKHCKKRIPFFYTVEHECYVKMSTLQHIPAVPMQCHGRLYVCIVYFIF